MKIKPHIPGLAFLLLLISTAAFLGYFNILFLHPQGIHFMRQTDSLSFVQTYYNDGNCFFMPRLFNLESTDGNAACEFPLVYYITSLLYRLFGEHWYFLRLLHMLIMGAGLFLTFKWLRDYLDDVILAMLIPMLLLTSTVLNHYTVNFLPDPAALGFTLTGWYFAFTYLKNARKKNLILAFIFFTLAGLIKITFLVSPLAFCLALIFHKAKNINTSPSSRVGLYLLTLGCIMLTASWYLYAGWYNMKYDSGSFNLKALPVWEMKAEEIPVVWDYITRYWYSKYFAHSTLHLILAAIVLQMLFIRKTDAFMSKLTLALFAGSLAYFALFYSQFRDHDYYFLALVPFMLFAIVNAVKLLLMLKLNTYLIMGIKIIMLVIVSAGINYSRMKLESRYTGPVDRYSRTGDILAGGRQELAKLNIPEDAKFVVYTDATPNGSLCFINHKGWTIRDTGESSRTLISRYMALGADYLLITADEAGQKPGINYPGKQIFSAGDYGVYKLRD